MVAPSYRFVDCRWTLGEPEAGREAYLYGHIPGAVFVDVERELAGPAGAAGRHPLPEAANFAAAMSRAGIDASTFVVAYGTLGGAERLWWLLRHFGHAQAAVIDLESWRGPLASGPERAPAAAFAAAERSGDTIDAEEIASRTEQLILLDARLPARFRGEPNPIDARPGRIPGARNTPWNEPLGELPPGEIAAYCGSGVTACVILHRLALAGRDGRLYPGSWSEWEQRQDLPLSRG
jgi:thiosulfate/3-mercaptopyruvate sulfurtransferase